MPLTEEQKAAIKTLAAVPSEDLEEAASALKDEAQPVFQKVFRKGYGTAQGEYEGENGKLTKAQAEAEAAKTRADKAEADLQEARKEQPDVDKIHTDYRSKLEEKDTELEKERKARKEERRNRIRADLRAELGVINDSDYADYLASKYVDRLKDKEDGAVELLEAPGSSVPVQIPQGQTPYKVLAGEILKGVAPDKKRADVDSGGGAGAGGGGTGGNKWEQRRAELEKEREGQKQSGPPVEERLGMARSS